MPMRGGSGVLARDQAEPGHKRFADLKLRVLSALVLAPIALGLLWLGGGAWAALVAVAAGGVAIEWARVCGVRAWALPGMILPVLVATASFATAAGLAREAVALLVLGAALLALGAWRSEARGDWLAGGSLYVGIAAIAVVWLREDRPDGIFAVLLVLLVVWASDIGAYLFGRLIGGPKLAPRLSPKKTWAGALGGLALAIVVGILMAAEFGAPSWVKLCVVAILLSLASQSGDLAESAFKRRFGVKDSGAIIPGHGGILDRLDGMLAAAPVAAIVALAWPGAGL